jgi:alkylation response protein AidB-like acyl-CoA dehydrogenase
MPYQPNASEVSAILFDVLRADQQLAELSRFDECDRDVMQAVLNEASAFIGEHVAPLNRSGDEIGAQWKDGVVTMPPGFKSSYEQFWKAGWAGISAMPEHGGQGMPTLMYTVVSEWLNAANQAWNMAPGLLHGAYECIRHFASDELKDRYAAKIASGEWMATMCLTEPHAGSDLGLCRTKSTPQDDGSYRVSGEKIFISGGEHDLVDNIIHLVLARLPDAPPGPKGLSLFLAPKIMPDGTRNGVHCDRIEEKMGLHASGTCAMRFDNAKAWIVGEPGKGLNAMFVMMNAARLLVAMQGVGTLSAAWQIADAYARERTQMRAPVRSDATRPADPIIEHPAMARVLDTQRAWLDAGRVLAYQTAIELDVAEFHPDSARRKQAEVWCALMTPVLKAAWTQQGFDGASACLQVLGGHGYVREWGIEQLVRDIRVAMIYEGTNEIQANDLLIRKVMGDGGAAMFTLIERLLSDVQKGGEEQASRAHAETLLRSLQSATQDRVTHQDLPYAYEVAQDYLQLAALAFSAWAHARLSASNVAAQFEKSSRAARKWVGLDLAGLVASLRREDPAQAPL